MELGAHLHAADKAKNEQEKHKEVRIKGGVQSAKDGRKEGEKKFGVEERVIRIGDTNYEIKEC